MFDTSLRFLIFAMSSKIYFVLSNYRKEIIEILVYAKLICFIQKINFQL